MPDQLQAEETSIDLCAVALDHLGLEGPTADKVRAIWFASENEEQLSGALRAVDISNFARATFVLAKRQEAIGSSLQVGYNPPPPDVDAEKWVIAAIVTMRELALALTHNLVRDDFSNPYFRNLFIALRESDSVTLFSEEDRDSSLALAGIIARGVDAAEVLKAVNKILDVACLKTLGVIAYETMLLTQTNHFTYEECHDRLINHLHKFYEERVIPNWYGHPVRLLEAFVKAEQNKPDA